MISDFFVSLIWFQTTEVEEGCTNFVVSPGLMLKLCQLMKTWSEVWIVSIDPDLLKLAVPWVKVAVASAGLASAGLANFEMNASRIIRFREIQQLRHAVVPGETGRRVGSCNHPRF